MSFRTPEVLLLLVLVPVAVVLFARAARQRREALRLFLGGRAAAETRYSERVARVRRWRAALAAGALVLGIVALAGPRWGTAVREAQQESLDLIVALDVSASMLAADAAPSRLARAKLDIARLAERRPGDRIGLVVFAGDAFLQCPLTSDRAALRLFLDAAGPDLVATPGTDFANALFTARSAFGTAEGPPRSRVVLVVSDGEDHEGGLDDAIDTLREEGIELMAAGVGTEEGAPVPELRGGRAVGYKTDDTGREVISQLQEGVLREIAGRDGLVRLSQREAVAALSDRLDRFDRALLEREEYATYAERYQWPLALALLLLLAERALALRTIPTRRRKPELA